LAEGVSVVHSFGEPQLVYSGSQTVSALSDWINDVSVPVAGEFSKDTQNRYKKKNLPILKVFIDVDYKSNLKRTNYYLNRLKKAAEDTDLAKKVIFAIVHRDDFKDEIEKFGLTNKDGSFAIDDHVNNQKYRSTAEFSVENIKAFAKDFLAGKLKSYIKSEPVPAPAAKGTVATIVGENFADIVLDDTKDVLIELYAPWCGHCKKLVPIYDELAASLKDVENVVIAKMDATANDSPHGKYQAKGYPTIFFAPAGKKDNPVPYSGERDVKTFTEFLKKNSSTWKVAKSEL
jgi:protein disulfide isomerase family A protein 3